MLQPKGDIQYCLNASNERQRIVLQQAHAARESLAQCIWIIRVQLVKDIGFALFRNTPEAGGCYLSSSRCLSWICKQSRLEQEEHCSANIHQQIKFGGSVGGSVRLRQHKVPSR